MNVDSTFINWNKATLLSLNSHISLSASASEKEIYENRLAAFKSFIDVEDYNQINKKSIRYNFLQELLEDTNHESNHFYVVEANHSGESVEIINYVVYLSDNNMVNGDIYHFEKGKWIKYKPFKKISFQIDNKLKDNFVKFGSGFNQDDVIITEFNNYEVPTSEYYVYSTLADRSSFKKILLLN